MKTAKIKIDVKHSALLFSNDIDGETDNFSFHLGSSDIEPNILDYIHVTFLKPLFDLMPFKSLELESTSEQPIVKYCISILRNTNNTINKHIGKQGTANLNKNILYLNVDNSERYLNHHASMLDFIKNENRDDVPEIFYENMNTGFNPKTRRWETESISFPFSVDELVERIESNKIKKIVTTNNYYLELVLQRTGVQLMVLCRMLGIEVVTLDNDVYEGIPGGIHKKLFFSDNLSRRFSFSIFHRYWDEAFESKNIINQSIPQSYQCESDIQLLEDNYKVAVLSHSRLNDVMRSLPKILFLLEHIPVDKNYNELTLWFMATRHLVQQNPNLSMKQKLHFVYQLHTLAYDTSQFLKFIIIDDIKTDRDIVIYGDDGWRKVFPKLYQNKYLSSEEQKDECDQKNTLFLQLNWGISYLEPSGSIVDALRANKAVINYSPIVDISGFQGFSTFEYNNVESLNFLINDYNAAIDQESFITAKNNYFTCVKNSARSINHQLIFDSLLEGGDGGFSEQWENTYESILQKITKYASENTELVDLCFKRLYLQPLDFDVNSSKYRHRAFFERMINNH